MSKPYLVFTITGKIRGVLASKGEKKIFESQRDMSKYKIIKTTHEDMNKLFCSYEYDLGKYLSINERGFILFPHEEFYMCESFEEDIEEAIGDVRELYNLASTYVKFEEDEENEMIRGLVEMLALFKEEREQGIFISDKRKGYFDLDGMIRSWIGGIDYAVLEDDSME